LLFEDNDKIGRVNQVAFGSLSEQLI
jgi:hypothetical protein